MLLFKMSLIIATFDVHHIIQTKCLFPLPYFLDKTSLQVHNNQRFAQKFYKRIGIGNCISVALLYAVIVLRLFWLILNWSSYSLYHLDQGILYVSLWCLISLFHVISFVMVSKANTVKYAVNQSLILTQKTSGNKYFEAILQIFAKGLIPVFASLIIIGFMMMPWGIEFEPVQLVIGNSIAAKVVASLIYLLTLLQPFMYTGSAFLLMISFLESCNKFSSRLHSSAYCASEMFRLSTINNFKKQYRLLVILRILIIIGCELCELPSAFLIFLGVILASCSGYATLKLYSFFPFFLYLAMPALTIICFLIAMLFTFVASVPMTNCSNFKVFWNRLADRRLIKMKVNAVPLISFSVGPYGIVTRKLGVTICDDIIRNTVTALLLDSTLS